MHLLLLFTLLVHWDNSYITVIFLNFLKSMGAHKALCACLLRNSLKCDVHCITDVDFCISLGGDGTVLHLTSLFVEDTPLPPVISFSMGTLGFLTPFDAGDFKPCLGRVLAANQDPVFCTLRTRKRCEVYW